MTRIEVLKCLVLDDCTEANSPTLLTEFAVEPLPVVELPIAFGPRQLLAAKSAEHPVTHSRHVPTKRHRPTKRRPTKKHQPAKHKPTRHQTKHRFTEKKWPTQRPTHNLQKSAALRPTPAKGSKAAALVGRKATGGAQSQLYPEPTPQPKTAKPSPMELPTDQPQGGRPNPFATSAPTSAPAGADTSGGGGSGSGGAGRMKPGAIGCDVGNDPGSCMYSLEPPSPPYFDSEAVEFLPMGRRLLQRAGLRGDGHP